MTNGPQGRLPDRIVVAPGTRRDIVLDAIHGAESQITLSLFRCTDKAVFDELTAAVDRGVDVRVLVTSRVKGGRKKLKKLWKRLEETGAVIVPYTDPVVKYHAKYMVVDDGPALITSMNFTRKCFHETCDGVAVTYDPAVVDGLRQLMATDREGGAAPATLPDRLIIGQKQLGHLRSHGKMMLVDGEQAIVGSLALTALSLDFRREVALLVDEPSAVAELDQLFRSIAAAVTATDSPSPATA